MSYSTEQLEALRRALVTGERRVSFADKTVEYRSVEELLAAMRTVEAELARAAAVQRTAGIQYPVAVGSVRGWTQRSPRVDRGSERSLLMIAFITDAPTVRDILGHLGEPAAPPRIAPARGPPLWEAFDAEHDPAADPLLQCAPAFEFDQRISW